MSKGNQIRIYAGKPLQDFLDARPLNTCKVSQARMGKHGVRDESEEITENVAINRLAERYEWVMRQSMPELSDETLRALYEVSNGWTEHTINEIESLSFVDLILDEHGVEAEDDESLDDLLARVEKLLGVEMQKLAKLGHAQKLAIIEATERYWGR